MSERETQDVQESKGGGTGQPKTQEDWQATLEAERVRAESNMAGWQRAQADFQNYKRRVEQERDDLTKYATAPVLVQCLTTLDDLERAFTVIPPSLAQLTWVEGIALIHRKLMSILEAQGVREIDAQDQPFDPQHHEAIAQGEGPEGTVVQVIQRGYYLYEHVLRPALVQVGNGSTASSDEKADGGQPAETKTDQN